ncbi:MAG: hypothetical protein ACYS7Y_11995 [Planctomycetota bacterium]|jgi:hypothetical protein
MPGKCHEGIYKTEDGRYLVVTRDGEEIIKPPGMEVFKTFRFHWLDGKVEDSTGRTVREAFTRLGYGAGALPALDHYEDLGEVK